MKDRKRQDMNDNVTTYPALKQKVIDIIFL